MGVAANPKSARERTPPRAPPELPRGGDIRERFDRLSGSVLLTEVETSQIVRHPPNTLKHWRLHGKNKGPKPVQMPSASVRYRVADVREWLANLSK
jgi:hypothetical protein